MGAVGSGERDRRLIGATAAAGIAGLLAAARFILVLTGQSSRPISILLVTGGLASGAVACWVLAPLTRSVFRGHIFRATGVIGVTAAMLGSAWLVLGIPSGYVAAIGGIATAVAFSVCGVTLGAATGVGPVSAGLIVAAGAMLIIPTPYGFVFQALGWVAMAAGTALSVGEDEIDSQPRPPDDGGPPISRAAKGEQRFGFAIDRVFRGRG